MKPKKKKNSLVNKSYFNKEHGSALVLTTLLLFVILAVVVTLSAVTMMEMNMSSKQKSSVGAFFKADAGVEWALNKIAYSTSSIIENTFSDISSSGEIPCPQSIGECKIYLLDEQGKIITNPQESLDKVNSVRVVGTQGQETQRAIEAAVAGTANPYSLSCFAEGAPDGSSGSTYLSCCRMNTSTGETKCKYSHGKGSWTPSWPNPVSSAPLGTYALSCFEEAHGNYNSCCLIDNRNGYTQCTTSNDAGFNWTNIFD